MRNFLTSIIFTALMTLVFSCKNEIVIKADLTIMADTTGKTHTLYEADHAGGGTLKEQKLLSKKSVDCTIGNKGEAILTFSDTSGFIEPIIYGLNLPEDWMKFKTLRFTLTNPNEFPVQVSFNIYGARNRMPFDTLLSPQEVMTGELSLIELPMIARNVNIYQPNAIHIDAQASQPNFGLIVNNIELIQTNDTSAHPVVDKLGQRIYADWKGKLHSADEFATSLANEKASLDTIPQKPDMDIYGGFTKGDKFTATGFFRVEQKNGVWWFVTPEGNPFWSFGVTGVRTKYNRADVTMVKEREYLFEELPAKDGPFSDSYSGDSAFSFYSWNIIRKYGDKDHWGQMAVKRLQKWGMNTIGNWSELALLKACTMPFTHSFRTTEREGLFIRQGLSDVFDPAWRAYADSLLSEAAEFKNNPYLIGYFIDNEGGWDKPDLLNSAKLDIPLRYRWESILMKKYPSLEKLNQSWNTDFNNWSEVRNIVPKSIDSLQTNPQFIKDNIELETQYAEEYFNFLSSTLKKYDPNHLYLGCRFTRQIKPEHIVRKAGKYCDVVTVNVYSLYPKREDLTKWYELSGRPILIGEHHLPLQSNRQYPPKYQAFTEDERIKYFPQYVNIWAEMPFSLGSHWYQYVDQHITGRVIDGENQTVGLVDITDQPHQHMVKAINEASKDFYQRHMNAK